MLNIEKNYVEYFNTIFLKILEFLSLLLLKFGMYAHIVAHALQLKSFNVLRTSIHLKHPYVDSLLSCCIKKLLPIYILSYMLPIYDGSISAGQEFWLFRVTFFKSRAFV